VKKLHTLVDESKDVPIPILVQCFQQLSSAASESDPIDICTTAEHLLRQETDAGQYWSITDSVTKSVQKIPENEKLSLMERILPTSAQQCTAERVMMIRCILSAMHSSRKHGVAAPEVGSVSVFVRLLELLHTCSEFDVHQQLVACVTTVLREQVRVRSSMNFEQPTNKTSSPILLLNTRQR
jgi:nucleolar pre-ribosomal-associated protein 2